MRGVLARRRCLLVFEASSNILLRRFRWYIMLPHRWFRWYRAIVATLRIRRLSLTSRQNDPIYRLVWVGGADIQVGERGLFSFDCGQSQDKTRPLLLKK